MTVLQKSITIITKIKKGAKIKLKYVILPNNTIALTDCFKQKEVIKNEFNGVWQEKDKSWIVSLNGDTISRLRACFGLKLDDKLNEMADRQEKMLELVKEYKENRLQPNRIYNSYLKDCELMEHQLTGATIMDCLFNAGFTGGILSMEMGTGKTLTAMAIVERLSHLGKANKVLIICPKIAINVWKGEYEKFGKDYKLRTIMGTPKKRLEAINDLEQNPNNRLNIAVINYEYMYAFESIMTKWQPDIIICDESHKIKSVASNQTKSITKVGTVAKYKLCLTGTPLTNNILDFFSQYRFMDSSIFGLNFYSFKSRYVITGMFGEYLRPNKNTFDEFKEKVNKIAYRKTKEECLDLPPYTDIIVPVDIQCKKIYKELEDDYITWLNETEFISVENALTKTLKLRQITSGFYYDKENDKKVAVFIDTAKVDACMELITQLTDNGNKVIVFAEFQAEIEKIKELCDKAKLKSATYYGKTPDKAKLEIVDNFQNGDLQVFIGQIESAGISITLTSASHMIFLSTGYKYGVYDQARARIHRKGQKNKCTYYHLIANNTIDTKIMKALQNKEALAQSIIDNYKNKKIGE